MISNNNTTLPVASELLQKPLKEMDTHLLASLNKEPTDIYKSMVSDVPTCFCRRSE